MAALGTPWRPLAARSASASPTGHVAPTIRSSVPRRMGTRSDRLSLLALARRLGATARRRGHPIYENPYRGKRADAWREGWQGVTRAGDRPRPHFQRGSFAAELYDYLVRHDRDDGLMVRELAEAFVERDSATVNACCTTSTGGALFDVCCLWWRGSAAHRSGTERFPYRGGTGNRWGCNFPAAGITRAMEAGCTGHIRTIQELLTRQRTGG